MFFNCDPDKTLDEQHISKIAKVVIRLLFRDYWATPEQRETIVKMRDLKRKELRLHKVW